MEHAAMGGSEVGAGTCGIVLAAEIHADTARVAVLAVLGVSRSPSGILIVVDLPTRAVVVTPYPCRDDVRVVVNGALDAATTPLLAGVLAAAVNRRPGLLVVDLRATASIVEEAARTLQRASEALQPWGGLLVAWHPPRPVRRVLQRCGLDDLIARDAEPVMLG